MNDDDILELAMQLMGRGGNQGEPVQPRLAQESSQQQQPMGDKDMEKAQQAMQIQQAAQQFPQRMSQQLDLQTHTGLPPLPVLLKMMMQQQRFPTINGAPVQNPNPAMPYPPQGGIRG